MKKLIILLIGINSFVVNSQDILFSSRNYSPISINPALSGSFNQWQANLIYRNQFLLAGNPFNSFLASGHISLFDRNQVTLGIESSSIFSSSNTSRTDLKGSVGYHLKMDDFNQLSIAMYSGLISQNSNLNNGTWGEQYNGRAYDSNLSSKENYITSQVNKIDVGAGIVYSSKNSTRVNEPTFQTGLAVYHLNQPNLSSLVNGDLKLPIRSSLFAKYTFRNYDNRRVITPNLNVNLQAKFYSYQLGFDINWSLIKHQSYNMFGKQAQKTIVGFGLYYRSSGAAVCQLNFQKDIFTIGLTYDMNLNIRNSATSFKSASEVFMRFSF